MLFAVKRMFFGTIRREELKHLADLNGREYLVMAPLIIAIFALGVAPKAFFDRIKPAANAGTAQILPHPSLPHQILLHPMTRPPPRKRPTGRETPSSPSPIPYSRAARWPRASEDSPARIILPIL